MQIAGTYRSSAHKLACIFNTVCGDDSDYLGGGIIFEKAGKIIHCELERFCFLLLLRKPGLHSRNIRALMRVLLPVNLDVDEENLPAYPTYQFIHSTSTDINKRLHDLRGPYIYLL